MKSKTKLALALAVSTLAVSPFAMAKNSEHGNNGNHGKHGYNNGTTVVKYHDDDKAYKKHKNRDNDYRTTRYNDDRLPPGLQKKVARGQALPPGWAKKLDDRYYTTLVRNGQTSYVLVPSVYSRATILERPRAGVVRVQVDNHILDILEATRAILNVLN